MPLLPEIFARPVQSEKDGRIVHGDVLVRRPTHDDPEPVTLATQHAPAGGITIAGKKSTLATGFDESKHPRGQPENAGEFVDKAIADDDGDEAFSPPNGTQPGYVWRVQPKGSELHGQKSRTSNDIELNGVMVFDNLNDLAAIDWMNEKDVELVKIRINRGDTFDTDDQEGLGLKTGRGEIVARKHFKDIRDVRDWATKKQQDNWS